MRFPKRNGALHCAAHFCVYEICIITNNADYIQYLPQNLLQTFSLLAAIHLFISSRDEIKISARWIKKLVAATDGVYVFIHYYNLAIASVTAGTLCPAAIYAVYTIYNTTNNAAPIKYLPQKISPTNIPTPKRFPILYIRNRDVARRFCESSRPFLYTWNMYFHQQRCANKTSLPKPFTKYPINSRRILVSLL